MQLHASEGFADSVQTEFHGNKFNISDFVSTYLFVETFPMDIQRSMAHMIVMEGATFCHGVHLNP